MVRATLSTTNNTHNSSNLVHSFVVFDGRSIVVQPLGCFETGSLAPFLCIYEGHLVSKRISAKQLLRFLVQIGS